MTEASPGRLSEEQLVDWLRLIRSENVGPRGIIAQKAQTRPDYEPSGDTHTLAVWLALRNHSRRLGSI